MDIGLRWLDANCRRHYEIALSRTRARVLSWPEIFKVQSSLSSYYMYRGYFTLLPGFRLPCVVPIKVLSALGESPNRLSC